MEDDIINLYQLGVKLEAIDIEILNLLVNDSRMSYAEIARHVHLSRMSVRDRVNKMLDEGIIERFTVKLNSRKIGLTTSIYLNIQTTPSLFDQVIKELVKYPNIESIYSVTGANALHVHAFLENFSILETFIDNIYKIKGITEVSFNVMTKKHKSIRLFT